MITTCATGTKRSRALRMEYGMKDAQSTVCAKDDVLREHRNVENCEQEKNARASIHDWAAVIPKL